MITVKQFYKEEKELEEARASDAAISKHRKIWDLASKGWELSRVGEKRWKKGDPEEKKFLYYDKERKEF